MAFSSPRRGSAAFDEQTEYQREHSQRDLGSWFSVHEIPFLTDRFSFIYWQGRAKVVPIPGFESRTMMPPP